MPFSSRKVLKAAEVYSPLLSFTRDSILELVWFSMSSLNFFKSSNVSDFCFNNYINLYDVAESEILR